MLNLSLKNIYTVNKYTYSSLLNKKNCQINKLLFVKQIKMTFNAYF